ncbi:histone deacetylase family protein [Pelagibius sp.]|uniref:histone deacetylase family protein n=1 Tax=Pelagibius sp. TaxID=1931238 RepID=UPI002613CD27|nr:histone deacetylase family protein [Pelagibius sp.]
MKAFYDPRHADHHPQFFLVRGQLRNSTEVPARADQLREGLEQAGHKLRPPRRFGLDPVRAVHTAEYLRFLEEAPAAWAALGDASAEIISNVHPNRHEAGGYPDSIIGRAGWHMADTACPLGPETYAAALSAADVALTAADAVLSGERAAYALCRPPGHHAYADMAGGFCFVNNSAVAAQYLSRHSKRVAVLDVDLHHGNGTQGIFWQRGDVMTISVHADPAQFYPFFWGYAGERGSGEGEGANLNLPLALGTGDEGFLTALEVAAEALHGFAPSYLVVALGLDASEDDPFGGLAITTDGFARIGAAIDGLGLPTVLVQEGGYLSPVLGRNLAAVLAAFA